MQFNSFDVVKIHTLVESLTYNSELEARFDNRKSKLQVLDFLKVKEALENNKSFEANKQIIDRKIIYEDNLHKLYPKFKENDKLYFKKKLNQLETPYDFRIMLSDEYEVVQSASTHIKLSKPIMYRDRIRNSFVLGLFSFDLTEVKEGASIVDVEDVKTPSVYEIEIEYLGNKPGIKVPKINEIVESFIKNIEYLVYLIQDSPMIMQDVEINSVSEEYNRWYVNRYLPPGRRMTLVSPLTKPVDLDQNTLRKIYSGYSVTEKTDGSRMVLFVSNRASTGHVYLIQHSGQTIKIKNTNLISLPLAGTILDGEYVKFPNGTFVYLVIDVLFYNTEDVRQKKLLERLGLIQSRIMPYLDKSMIVQKDFLFSSDTTTDIKKILSNKYPYKTDGLIFTPLDSPYDKNLSNIFKWKPHELLTLDFLILKNDKKPTEWHLYFNSKGKEIQPFKHKDFPKAHIVNVSEEVNRKYKDASIVEFEWTDKVWKPVKSRPDKTVGNFSTVVDAVFDLILKPITKEMLLNPEPFYKPIEKSISERSKSETVALRDFHNYIKDTLLHGVSKGSTVLDFGSGKGGDIFKWLNRDLNVDGFEIVLENINTANERLLKLKPKSSIKFHHLDLASESVQDYFYKLNGKYKNYDTVSIFFSIHYFFDSVKSINNLFKNISQSVKKGGQLLIATFDAESVFKLLEPIKEGESHKTKVFEITKKYESGKPLSQLAKYGNKIIVKINDTELREGIPEFLVKKQHLEQIAEKHGFNLKQTGLFSEMYSRYTKAKLSPEEQQLSFLNRFYIFERVRGDSLLEQEKMV